MASHIWGDGFDFDRLNKAGNQIENIFMELSGLQLHWKEKYGTLRYEWFSNPKVERSSDDWLLFIDLNNEHFLFSVMITVSDFPDMASEILSNFLFHNKWDDINKHRDLQCIKEELKDE